MDRWQICGDKEREKNEMSGEIKGERKRGEKQRVCVDSMAAVAVTFLAEQISWPEEKDKHRRGNRV